MISVKKDFSNYIGSLQGAICRQIEQVDSYQVFHEDNWERDGGGGGTTRILQDGKIFEKAGVNTSAVFGQLPNPLKDKLNTHHSDFYASGISLVIHPLNPMAPTVHANLRYFELYEDQMLVDQWFGGGVDLTPYYFFEDDVVHFHSTLKYACDLFSEKHYPEFKKSCDEYFFNSHRNEARGVGGIFFDYLRPNNEIPIEYWLKFVKEVGNNFQQSYFPIIEKRAILSYGENEKYWQEVRRGRYVEFNLLHDRGTLFGLKTNGRIESILMSLPPRVRWVYDYKVEQGSKESKLLKALKPRDWVNYYEISADKK